MEVALISIAKEQVNSITKEVFKLIVGVDDELENISTTLTTIQVELKDAEERLVREGPVKVWLEDLRDISYNIDDVLDEWSTRTLMLQIEVVDNSSLVRKVCGFFRCFCLNEDVVQKVVFFISRFGFDQLILRHNIAHKIKNIRKRLDFIANEKNKYNFFNFRDITMIIEPDRPTFSIDDNPNVYGRTKDKEIIISKLMSESSHENENNSHTVISIVGMGALGKSTLARLVFYDDRVMTHFEKKIWVRVSQTFDKIKVTKEIINAIPGEKLPHEQSWKALQQHLYKSIKEQRFLLVLDHMWTDKYRDWEPFKLSLRDGARGSRIMVTTRNIDVANMMGSSYIHKLDILSDEDSWSLLGGIALFDRRSEEECKELEGIGMKIAAKCKGLPLAAKTLGGLLRLKKTKQEWVNVLESETWISEWFKEGVIPALLLSYYHLPSHLKCCFEYCAIFPKDSTIYREEIIRLWMAHGFLTSSEGGERMERVGDEYFNKLVNCSLLRVVEVDENGIVLSCNMHDMVHDLVQFITNKECLIIEQDVEFGCSPKTRHLNLYHIDDKRGDVVASILKSLNLRTLRSTGCVFDCLSPVSLFNFTCLRSLDLERSQIEELPSDIEKLLHLRYLNLSCTPLVELPASVSKLYNLQTLILNNCKDLVKLPPGIVNLRKMRCLDIFGTLSLVSMPKGMGRLTTLRTLTQLMVSDNSDGCKICELQNLNHLTGKLEIKGLENVTSRDEATQAELSNKQHLRGLGFHWSETVADEEKDRCEVVLDGFRPPSNLESLEISNYPGTTFPKNWMSRDDGMTLYYNLRILRISDCEKCLRLSLPELPSLKVLNINRLKDVRYIGRNFSGIKDDEVEEMHSNEDENDDDINIMPNLCELQLYECSKLKVLPRHLSHTRLRVLEVSNCPSLSWASSCLHLPLLEELKLRGDVGDLSQTLASKYVFLPRLESLNIYKSLPEGLCNLTTLRVLSINACGDINNLYEELQRLNMLQELHLSFLSSEREKEAAEYLMKTSRIPHITINHRRIK